MSIYCTECSRKKYFHLILKSRFCIFCRKKTPNRFIISVMDKIYLYEGQRIKKKSKEFRGYASFYEMGWFSSKKFKAGVERLIIRDKEKDEYHEIVKDYDTKIIDHECHEKLSDHKGHGSAKNIKSSLK